MASKFLPYYLSRALLSLVFAGLVFGLTWQGLLFALALFGLFLLYLHSGWFQVDAGSPLAPLRRDERGRDIQRKALIVALPVVAAVYLVLSWNPGSSASTGSVAVTLGVLAYFITQFILFARA